MLTKKQFKQYMSRIRDLWDIEDGVDEAYKKLSPDWGGFHLGKHRDLIVDILKAAMGDEYDLIGYFIWEIYWGKKGKNCITDNGKRVSLCTINALYNYLYGRQRKNKTSK